MEVLAGIVEVGSVQRLVDAARTAYALGVKLFAAARVYGGAAVNGVPEVFKLAMKLGTSFVVLSDFSDMVEALKPDKVLVVSREAAGEAGVVFEPKRGALSDVVAGAERVLIVIGGGEADVGRQLAGKGIAVYPAGTTTRLAPAAELALTLLALP